MARVVVWVKIYDNDKEIVPEEEGAGRGLQQEALLAVQVSSRNQGEQVCRELAAYLIVLAKEDPAATAVADTFAREDDHPVKIEQDFDAADPDSIFSRANTEAFWNRRRF